jgi:spore coat protein B
MNRDIMKCFIGKIIRVDRGGPESRIGMLMDASDDLIVLLTEDDGVVYYSTKHIKSFTDNMKEQLKFNIEVPKDFQFKKAANFQDLLDLLKLKWIKINRGGPEKIEGVLSEVNKGFVFLINNQEIVRLSMSHIKSISYGVNI